MPCVCKSKDSPHTLLTGFNTYLNKENSLLKCPEKNNGKQKRIIGNIQEFTNRKWNGKPFAIWEHQGGSAEKPTT